MSLYIIRVKNRLISGILSKFQGMSIKSAFMGIMLSVAKAAVLAIEYLPGFSTFAKVDTADMIQLNESIASSII